MVCYSLPSRSPMCTPNTFKPKVTLTAKISNIENKLKEADKEKSQLREKKTASKGRIEQLEAEVKHLKCCVPEAKERAHRNIMEQVHHLAPGIDFSHVHHDYRVVNGEIVNPNKKDSVNNPPLSQDVASHNVNNPPLPQHVASQNVNNPPLWLYHKSSLKMKVTYHTLYKLLFKILRQLEFKIWEKIPFLIMRKPKHLI
ncbi:hypothetical protein S83_070791 [Arachis hypogaea]